MMLVKTEVRPCQYGLGVFSCEKIPKGAKVWEWNPLTEVVIDESQLESSSPVFRDFLNTYSYRVKGVGLVVNLDNGRFMNHSDNPNVIEGGDYEYAARDIEIGDELTCDYRALDIEMAHCGSFLNGS